MSQVADRPIQDTCPKCGHWPIKFHQEDLQVIPQVGDTFKRFRPGALMGECDKHGLFVIQEAEPEHVHIERERALGRFS